MGLSQILLGFIYISLNFNILHVSAAGYKNHLQSMSIRKIRNVVRGGTQARYTLRTSGAWYKGRWTYVNTIVKFDFYHFGP